MLMCYRALINADTVGDLNVGRVSDKLNHLVSTRAVGWSLLALKYVIAVEKT